MMDITLLYHGDCVVEGSYQQLVFAAIRETFCVYGPKDIGEQVSVDLTLTDDKTIKTMNNQHRHMNKPTDVLSFPQYQRAEEWMEDYGLYGEIHLGDIVISLDRAKAQAEEYGHSMSREVAFLAVHGMLHLLLFDHEEEADTKKMREAEETILLWLQLRREP